MNCYFGTIELCNVRDCNKKFKDSCTYTVKAATLARPFKMPVRMAPVLKVKQKQHL